MSDGSAAGLTRLMKAESDAQKIIEDARNARRAQVKRAQDEAKSEIDSYRRTLEEDFKKKQDELLKGSETHKEDLRVSTEASIKSIQEAARHKQEEVIKTLLDIVSRVVIVRRNDAEAAAL